MAEHVSHEQLRPPKPLLVTPPKRHSQLTLSRSAPPSVWERHPRMQARQKGCSQASRPKRRSPGRSFPITRS